MNRFSELNILVCGEVCVDKYVKGNSTRNNPECSYPVPVLSDLDTTDIRLGMTANVVENIRRLGGKAELYTVSGKGSSAYRINEAYGGSCLIDHSRPVIEKTRVICNSKQIVRIDSELTSQLTEEMSAKYFNTLCEAARTRNFSAVILQDYGKGLWNDLTLQFIQYAKSLGLPVYVDPYKNRSLDKYAGAHLIKPNLPEAIALTGKHYANECVWKLKESTDIKYVVVTCGGDGMWTLDTQNPEDISRIFGESVGVVDVTGAGDTAIATLTLAMCSGLSFNESCYLANKASSISIQQFGISTVGYSDIFTAEERQ